MPDSDGPPIIDPTGKTAQQIEREIEASMVLYGEALITPPYPSHHQLVRYGGALHQFSGPGCPVCMTVGFDCGGHDA